MAERIEQQRLTLEAAAARLDLSREWVRQVVEGEWPSSLHRGTRRKLEAFVYGIGAPGGIMPTASFSIEVTSAAVGEFRAIQRIAGDLARFAAEAGARLEAALIQAGDRAHAAQVADVARAAVEAKSAGVSPHAPRHHRKRGA